MNAKLEGALGIAVAVALTAGVAGMIGLELERSFDPAPAERFAIRTLSGNTPAGALARPAADGGLAVCC